MLACATSRELDHKVDEESAAAIQGEAGKKIAASKGAVSKAEQSVEAVEGKMSERDGAIADAQSRITAAEEKVASIEKQLDAAKKNLDIAEHSLKIQEIRKESHEALAEVKKDVVLVEQAKHEITKFKAVAGAQGVSGPLYQENLARFEKQLAEAQGQLADAKERHASLQSDAAAEQKYLDDMKK